MKRIFGLCVLILLCLTLVSCKKIKEPKIKGNLAEYARVVDYIVNVRNVHNEKIHQDDQWYNIDMESYALVENQDEIENLKMSMKVSGKVLDAEYAFDSKGKLKYEAEIKGTLFATEDETETYKLYLKYDMELKFIEGKSYCKIRLKGKVDKNKFDYTLKTNLYHLQYNFETLYSQIGDLIDESIIEELMNLDVFGDILSSFSALSVINELEDALDDDLKNIYMQKNKVTIEDRHFSEKSDYLEEIVSVKSFELSLDNYQLKNLNEYYHIFEEDAESLYELTSSISVKQAMFGSVKAPIDELEYGF